MEQVGLRIKGSVRYFQRDNLTGLIVPGTEHEEHNIIVEDLSFYLAYKIGTETINQSLSSRFTVGGTLSSGDNGDDGIAYGPAVPGVGLLSHKLDTDINAGGDNATNYIEFSGSIAGQLSMSGYLHLGHDYLNTNDDFEEPYAYYSISAEIDSGRTFYFYWRLTLT